MIRFAFTAAALLAVMQQLPAASLTIDFENLPALPAQPNNYVAAGAMQTYSNAHFSISGGVVLGNPSFLAGFGVSAGSPPNLYGTTDIADPTLLSVITLTFPFSDSVLGVTGVLFNGQSIPENYTIAVFSGATPLIGATFIGVPAASSTSDFVYFSLAEPAPITRITFTTPNADINGWDFLVDNITTVPEPSSALLLLSGGILLWAKSRHAARRLLRRN